MNNLITSTVKMDNDNVTFTWHPGVILENVKLRNIYGFCVNKDKKVALVRDKDEARFTLPGGGVQEGETGVQALNREFMEEAQFYPQNIKLLGSLEVVRTDQGGNIVDHQQQARFICSIDDPGDHIPEKDGWETVERIFVEIEDLPKYLEWIIYPTGKAVYDEFLKNL